MTTETSVQESNKVECSYMKEVQNMTECHSHVELSHTGQPGTQRPQTVVISQHCNQIVLQLIHNQSEEEEESSCSDEQNTIVLYVDGENNNEAAEATPLADCQTILQIANQRTVQVLTKDSEEGLKVNATNGEDEQERDLEHELELSNSEADLKLTTYNCVNQETQKSITENEVACEDLAKGTRYSLIQIDGNSNPESLGVDIEKQVIDSAAQTEAAVVVLHNAEALEDNPKESASLSTHDEGRTIIKISEDGSYIQAEDGAIIHITDSQSGDGSDNSQDGNSETYYVLEVEEREDGVKEYRCLHSNEIVVQVANKSKEVEVQTPEDPSEDSGTPQVVLMPNSNILSYYRSLGHYKCNQCDKVFGLKGNLKQHMALHTNEKPFECNICGQTFTLKGNMKKHLQLHNGDKKFQCKLCEKVFSTKGNLKQHVLNHDGSKPFGCRICHKTFRIKGNLTKHMALHEERPYKCDICFMPFTGEKRLAAHMLRHDSQYAVKVETDEIVLCPVCNESFPYSSNLSVHFKIEHSNQLLRYKCNLCSKLCKERGAYLRHKAIHSRPFKCEICDKTFPVACILQRHLICHSEEKPFKCTFCGRAFSRFGNLERHNIRNSRKNLYNCHICEEKFEVGCSLKKHFSEKHNEGNNGTPTKPFSCNICDKTFMLETALNAHLKKHEQVSTPTCAFCGTSFPDKIALKEHSEIHKGEKIQKCYICRQIFNELDLLKRHFQSEHAEKLNKCDICGREFLLAKDLKRHMKIHKPERDHKCIECGKEFTYSFGLTRHMKTHRKEDKVHKCETCGKTFSLIDYLKRHVKTHNKTHKTKSLIGEGEGGFHCDICSETFASEVDLDKHMNCHESESSPKCEYSSETPKQVNDSEKLKKPSSTNNRSTTSVQSRNSRKSTKKVKFDSGKSKKNAPKKSKSEEIVVKSGNSNENSGQVNDLVQSKENACLKNKTDKTVITTEKKTKMISRQEIIDIESDNKTHICGICGVKFKQASSLRRHEKTHTGKSHDAGNGGKNGTNPKTSVAYKRKLKSEQSCTCSVCGKCFMAESILKRHSNIHKKHQPYRCEECGKCFASEEELINHIDGIHCGGHLKDHSNTAAKERRRKRSWKCIDYGQNQEDVKPLLCSICAKVFSSSEGLKRHIKTCWTVD
ncbi:hypothetical protein CHS0354_020025 [Potamilus streckersoni]|uniref:Zinc finger protein 865 n=1 Tax=Potamilus streckersoni TaxID=2493646 RepID=A0AAE0VQU2_9BIVA|nr:hypothetical protein CHS0354_020025 [Potamilus streckersoni]